MLSLLHTVCFGGFFISKNSLKLHLLWCGLLKSVSFFLHFREPTEASSAYALSATLCLILSYFREPTEASFADALSATLCLILSSFWRTHRSFICLCPVCYPLSHSFFISENPQKLHLLMPCLLQTVCLIFVPFREPTIDSSALAQSATIACVRSSLQRASGSVHLLWAHLLPEAEAHGGGQDARPGQRASRSPHAPAHRGASQGRWAAAGRDGERLSHWIWSQVCALLWGWGGRVGVGG